MHNITWVTNTMLSSRKSQKANSKKISGQKDEQTLFIGPLWLWPVVQ